MVPILNQIKQDAKQALKKGEKEKSKSLRYLVSVIETKQVELGEDFTQEDAFKLLQKELKQKKEALQAFEEGDRNDLADEEKREIKLLKEYLPEMMDEDEIQQVVEEVVKASGSNNFGQIMGQVMARVKGKADGEKVSRIVRKVLEQ